MATESIYKRQQPLGGDLWVPVVLMIGRMPSR